MVWLRLVIEIIKKEKRDNRRGITTVVIIVCISILMNNSLNLISRILNFIKTYLPRAIENEAPN